MVVDVTLFWPFLYMFGNTRKHVKSFLIFLQQDDGKHRIKLQLDSTDGMEWVSKCLQRTSFYSIFLSQTNLPRQSNTESKMMNKRIASCLLAYFPMFTKQAIRADDLCLIKQHIAAHTLLCYSKGRLSRIRDFIVFQLILYCILFNFMPGKWLYLTLLHLHTCR